MVLEYSRRLALPLHLRGNFQAQGVEPDEAGGVGPVAGPGRVGFHRVRSGFLFQFLDAGFERFDLLFQILAGVFAPERALDPILKTRGAGQDFPTDDNGNGPDDEIKRIVHSADEILPPPSSGKRK